MPERGLIVGKFFPPHRGHQHLIETALARVERLSVVVCERPGERPEGALRAGWLRELYPAAEVLLLEDRLDPDDSRAWAREAVRLLGRAPDVVFTSEDYGPRWAAFLGARHVMVDRERAAFPISGSRVRADPLACWEYLPPPVRGYYALRVVLVGAESTGKTTLAARLAERLGTCWVPEYGRELSERKLAAEGVYCWSSEEFLHIARTQIEREEAAARMAETVLVCDTDAFATTIWHRRYMGARSPEVEALAEAHRRPDLYLLAAPDAPFVQDGTRDGEVVREWMHELFREELTAAGRPFQVLSGSWQEREEQAAAAVGSLLERRTGMRP